MIRVYVAGAYSDDNILGCLENMRTGIKKSLEVLDAGFSPFVPWFDYLFTLMREDSQKIGIQEYYDYSMAWLEASDCVLISHGHEHSKGTQAEIQKATKLGIPVFFNLKDLVDYFK